MTSSPLSAITSSSLSALVEVSRCGCGQRPRVVIRRATADENWARSVRARLCAAVACSDIVVDVELGAGTPIAGHRCAAVEEQE